MKNIQNLNQSELRKIEGGIIDGPISDWVACTIRSIIDKVKEDGVNNSDFAYCGTGNNVRC